MPFISLGFLGFFRVFLVKNDWPKLISARRKARQSGGFWPEPPGPRAGDSQAAPAPFTSLLDAPCKSLPGTRIGPIGGPSRSVSDDECTAKVNLGQ